MKKGIAKREKLSKPVPIRCATVVIAGILDTVTIKVNMLDSPKLQATGTPIPKKNINEITRINIGKISISGWF
jgi:hypothetical protein